MKEIDKAMKGRFTYKDTELKWVLQQLHRHRRENWQNSQDPEKRKSEKKRKGINSRRGDVSNLTRTCLLYRDCDTKSWVIVTNIRLTIEKRTKTKRPCAFI
jgi:hypothetical protein